MTADMIPQGPYFVVTSWSPLAQRAYTTYNSFNMTTLQVYTENKWTYALAGTEYLSVPPFELGSFVVALVVVRSEVRWTQESVDMPGGTARTVRSQGKEHSGSETVPS